MEFEKVLREIGGYGLFNKTIVTAALVLSTWHATFCYFGQVFIHITPASQWCFLNDTGEDTGPPVDVTTLPRGRCQLLQLQADGQYGSNESTVTEIASEWVTCPTRWYYDNSEIYTTVTMENQWVCGDSWKMYAVHTAYFTGSIVSYLLTGFLADRIGRKKTVILVILIGATGNLLGTFFPTFSTFPIWRFLTSMGSDTVCTTIYVIALEYTVKERRTLVAFLWAINWSVLATALPWYTYLIQSWRGLLITNTVIDAVLLVSLWWLPESSGWLLSVGKNKKALETFQKIARFNGKTVTEERLNELLQDPATKDPQGNAPKQKTGFWKTTLAVVKYPRLRRIVILSYLGCFIVCLCYNSNALGLGRLGLNLYAIYSIAIAFELPVNILCITALDILGRRWPNAGFMLLGGVVCLLMAIMRTDNQTWTLLIGVISMMSFAGGYNITFQTSSELFPTVIRGRVLFLQRLMGDIGSLLGAQVASLTEYDKYLPMLVMGILSLIAAALLFMLPETLNQALPQTIEDGENFARGQSFFFCPLVASRRSRRKARLSQTESNGVDAKSSPTNSVLQERL
ncbi:organic anion transporter 3-like [Amblyomma americanum]|uniref:Major facilitator superfamily (MFS) profile domain-containing protein n=1 Tax=Amblyomma americanum TaxID=6943 RepID=A0AAQ4EP86_AMBAM